MGWQINVIGRFEIRNPRGDVVAIAGDRDGARSKTLLTLLALGFGTYEEDTLRSHSVRRSALHAKSDNAAHKLTALEEGLQAADLPINLDRSGGCCVVFQERCVDLHLAHEHLRAGERALPRSEREAARHFEDAYHLLAKGAPYQTLVDLVGPNDPVAAQSELDDIAEAHIEHRSRALRSCVEALIDVDDHQRVLDVLTVAYAREHDHDPEFAHLGAFLTAMYFKGGRDLQAARDAFSRFRERLSDDARERGRHTLQQLRDMRDPRELTYLREVQHLCEASITSWYPAWVSMDARRHLPAGNVVGQPGEQRTTLLELVERHSKVVVEGGPGSGKSGSLRVTAAEYCERRLAGDGDAPLPILLSADLLDEALRRGSTTAWRASLEAALTSGASLSPLDVPLSEASVDFSIKALLDPGSSPVAILIDGLDEIRSEPPRLHEFLGTVWRAASERAASRLIVSARTGRAPNLGEGALLMLDDYDQPAVESFVRAWFGPDRHGAAEQVIDAHRRRGATVHHLGSPLMSALFCMVSHDGSGVAVGNDTDLLFRAICYLLAGVGRSNQIPERNYWEAPRVLTSLRALELIAAEFVSDDNILQTVPVSVVSDPHLHDFTASGLLQVVSGGTRVRFLHSNIRDYLLARHIVGATQSPVQYVDYVWSQPEWCQILIFVAELDDAHRDQLLGALKERFACDPFNQVRLLAASIAAATRSHAELIDEAMLLVGTTSESEMFGVAATLAPALNDTSRQSLWAIWQCCGSFPARLGALTTLVAARVPEAEQIADRFLEIQAEPQAEPSLIAYFKRIMTEEGVPMTRDGVKEWSKGMLWGPRSRVAYSLRNEWRHSLKPEDEWAWSLTNDISLPPDAFEIADVEPQLAAPLARRIAGLREHRRPAELVRLLSIWPGREELALQMSAEFHSHVPTDTDVTEARIRTILEMTEARARVLTRLGRGNEAAPCWDDARRLRDKHSRIRRERGPRLTEELVLMQIPQSEPYFEDGGDDRWLGHNVLEYLNGEHNQSASDTATAWCMLTSYYPYGGQDEAIDDARKYLAYAKSRFQGTDWRADPVIVALAAVLEDGPIRTERIRSWWRTHVALTCLHRYSQDENCGDPNRAAAAIEVFRRCADRVAQRWERSATEELTRYAGRVALRDVLPR